MSFAPITRWALRCDGDTTRGQCPELLAFNAHPDVDDCYAPTDPANNQPGSDPANNQPANNQPGSDLASDLSAGAGGAAVVEDADWREVLLDAPALDAMTVSELRAAGWHVARDGWLLCRRHVAALEYLARAEIDGLPFPTTQPTHTELTGTEEES